MTTLSHRQTADTARHHGFSAMEKIVLAALCTLPLSGILLITGGLHDFATRWL